MLYYWNKQSEKFSNSLRIQYDYIYQFDGGDATETVCTFDPSVLQDALAGIKLPVNVYQIYWSTVSKSLYNPILNYKGIWWLMREKPGDYCSKIDISNRIIYWGIKKVESLWFSHYSSIAIFSNDVLDFKRIQEQIEQCDFEVQSIDHIAQKIASDSNNGLTTLSYVTNDHIVISLFGLH